MKLTAVLFALALPAVALAADAPSREIRFPKGAVGVTLVGKVGAVATRYRFTGRSGQRLRVTVSSRSNVVVADVSGDGKVIPMGASDEIGRIDAQLPYFGRFSVEVRRENGRGLVPYTLKVTITG